MPFAQPTSPARRLNSQPSCVCWRQSQLDNFPSMPVEAGHAIRIMTGAPMPSGADTVVRVEDTDGGIERVAIRNPRDSNRNIRPRGEDLRAGDTVLPAGTPVGAAQIGVLSSVGAASVDVYRRPRVAYLGSGDELVDLRPV